MVVKFFSNKKGGSSKAIDYLLNEREAQGTAKVLQGDPQLTREIINSLNFKQKTTVGCLAFEEKNISQKMKYKHMKEFEEMLLPGMQDRYNILWVEHRDKEILELNFVIPKIDLVTQKSLNPYYHKADLPRVEKWQDLQNLQYGYSNPKDPSKARTLETNSKEIHLSKDYEQLDKLLHNLVRNGKINNRTQMIELLKENNIEITRQNKENLSLKLPQSKKAKKFKGGIYSEQFTSPEQLRELGKRARAEINEYNQRDTQRECERLSTELESYTRDKFEKLRKQFRKTREPTTAKIRRNDDTTQKISKKPIDVDTQASNPEIRGNEKYTSRTNSNDEKQNVENDINFYVNNDHNSNNSNIFNSKGIENDSTRTTAERSRRERARAFRRAKEAREERERNFRANTEQIHSRIREKRREIYKRVAENNANLSDKFKLYEDRIRESYQLINDRVKRAYRKCRDYRRFGAKLSRAVEEITKSSLDYRTEPEKRQGAIAGIKQLIRKLKSSNKLIKIEHNADIPEKTVIDNIKMNDINNILENISRNEKVKSTLDKMEEMKKKEINIEEITDKPKPKFKGLQR